MEKFIAFTSLHLDTVGIDKEIVIPRIREYGSYIPNIGLDDKPTMKLYLQLTIILFIINWGFRLLIAMPTGYIVLRTDKRVSNK